MTSAAGQVAENAAAAGWPAPRRARRPGSR